MSMIFFTMIRGTKLDTTCMILSIKSCIFCARNSFSGANIPLIALVIKLVRLLSWFRIALPCITCPVIADTILPSSSLAIEPTPIPRSVSIRFKSFVKPSLAGPVVPSAIPPSLEGTPIGLVNTLKGVSTSALLTAPRDASSPPVTLPGV